MIRDDEMMSRLTEFPPERLTEAERELYAALASNEGVEPTFTFFEVSGVLADGAKALMAVWHDTPRPSLDQIRDAYRGLLTLCGAGGRA